MGKNRKSSARQHKHCEKCFNQHCKVSVETSVSCVIVVCQLHCGASFHLCKEDEHQLLCPNEKVPCLNADYGCPFSMARHKLAKHLGSCPASVVNCSLEWNRWPVLQTDAAFYQNALRDPNAAEQLDLATALRDQTLLFSSLKMGSLFPELVEKTEEPTVQEPVGAVGCLVPVEGEAGSLPSAEVSACGPDEAGAQELSQEEREALARRKDLDCLEKYSTWEGIFRKEREGCKQTVKNLENQTHPSDGKEGASSNCDKESAGASQGDQENSATSNDTAKQGYAPWQHGVLDRMRKEANIAEYNMFLVHHGNMLIHFGQMPACTPREKDFVYGNLEPIEVQTIRSYNVPTSYRAKRSHLKDPSKKVKRFTQSVDTSDLGVSTENIPMSDEVQATLLCSLEREFRGHQICETVGTDGLYVDLGTQTYDFPSAPFKADTSLADVIADRAPNLHVQIQTECVTRRHNKATSAFTYLCCHTFRRDEYPSHFRNVHADIQSCLNGWFVQRCPLAYLGCTYSQKRFRPATQRATITYNQDLGTFSLRPEVAPSLFEGMKTVSTERKWVKNLDSLSRLPFELLQHIAGFLDCFSLSQLAQVSELMREVCATLLRERGMVSLKWEKKTYSHGGSCWRAKNKVWEFSSHFSTVDKWSFNDVPSMSEHLRVCPFYQTETRSEPVALASMERREESSARDCSTCS